MNKKVLVISTSLRDGSNSEALADAFMKGAETAGHQVEKVTLKGKAMGFCKGCLVCQKTRRCVIQDDAVKIAEQMRQADVIAFATPVYYYEMSGQLKTLLDRANALYASDYAFRGVYLLTSAADRGEGVPEKAVSGFSGWVACFPKVTLSGTVFAGGVNDPGEINGHPALQKAYDMGASIQ